MERTTTKNKAPKYILSVLNNFNLSDSWEVGLEAAIL